MSIVNPINEYEASQRQVLKAHINNVFGTFPDTFVLEAIYRRLKNEENIVAVQLEVLLERMKEKERLEIAVRNGFHT